MITPPDTINDSIPWTSRMAGIGHCVRKEASNPPTTQVHEMIEGVPQCMHASINALSLAMTTKPHANVVRKLHTGRCHPIGPQKVARIAHSRPPQDENYSKRPGATIDKQKVRIILPA